MDTVFTASDEDRERLREPRGDVVQDDELITELERREFQRLICVGDRVSMDVANSAFDFDIAIVDGKIERESIGSEDGHHIDTDLELSTENPAGIITEDAWNTVREAFAHDCSTTVEVAGEEDLLALPSILFASPDSLIVYGDRWNGAVILESDEALKRFARDIIGYEPYPHVIVGGSWDHFHAGHRYILLAAFEHGRHVDIGVTTDAMLQTEDKNEADVLQDVETRRAQVERFLEEFGLVSRGKIIPIDDFMGNAVDVEQAVLLVTRDTMENGKRINEARLEQRKTPLNLAVIDRVTAQDGNALSSTRIRDGEIDQNGFVL